MLSRAGRKRKSGARYPSGRLREVPADYRVLMAMQPHRRDLPEKERLGTGAVTELGRLQAKQQISMAERLAGEEFARVYILYRATINPPRGLVGGGGAYQCVPEACRLPDSPGCTCANRWASYSELEHVVSREGHRVIVAFKRLVLDDQRLGDDRLLAIRGLVRLANYLSLTERGRH